MSSINTEYLQKCLATLEKSYDMIKKAEPDSVEYEMYRNALVKGFEMTLEQSGKLLKKRLLPFFSGKKALDMLAFKDIFRSANKFSLLSPEETERWMSYRDNRNNTAHDYGEEFANDTLVLMATFIPDVKHLMTVIEDD